MKSDILQGRLVARRFVVKIDGEEGALTISPPLHVMVTGTARPIDALFGFSSDLCANPTAEIARYRKIDPNADKDPALSVIEVRGEVTGTSTKVGNLFPLRRN